MGVRSVTSVSPRVSVAHKLLEFTCAYPFHVPWEVNAIVPIIQMRKLRLICKWWVRVTQEDLKEKGCENN